MVSKFFDSVIANWKRELDTWGHFAVSIYQGSEKEKQLYDIRDGINDIMICGKALFIDKAHFASIGEVPWKLIIVDEFHEFKTRASNSSDLLLCLRDKVNCPILGLTGTLMPNNHKELWSLIDLVQPNHLGSLKDFNKIISRPIKHGR